MSELKSRHLWAMAADFTAPKAHDEDEEGNPTDFNTPDFVVRAMLNDLHTLEAQLAQAQAERDEWRQRHADCTTSLITADRTIERITNERNTASRNARHYSQMACELEAERDALLTELRECRARLSGTEAAWEDIEDMMMLRESEGDDE